MNEGQTEVATGVTIGKGLVVEAEEVKIRCPQIIEVLNGQTCGTAAVSWPDLAISGILAPSVTTVAREASIDLDSDRGLADGRL
jgi:hypothetical protein